jgi:outer membrane receptor for ferrienterochelin and colicins
MSIPSASLRPTLLAASLLAAFSAHAPVRAQVQSQPQSQPRAPAQAPQAAPMTGDRQAVDTGKPQPGAMQKVEVQGKADAYDPRRDDTASKIVVNHDELVKYGDTTVLDALKRVPGVTVNGSGGRGGEIRMRGLGAGYTQILLNGERAPAGFDITSLSPDVIERIEVLRAASAEFSTQSIAGTINIVLKKTVRTAQRELKLGYGRGNAIKSPTVSLQLADKAGQAVVVVRGQRVQQRIRERWRDCRAFPG